MSDMVSGAVSNFNGEKSRGSLEQVSGETIGRGLQTGLLYDSSISVGNERRETARCKRKSSQVLLAQMIVSCSGASLFQYNSAVDRVQSHFPTPALRQPDFQDIQMLIKPGPKLGKAMLQNVLRNRLSKRRNNFKQVPLPPDPNPTHRVQWCDHGMGRPDKAE
jgi:hypothetical protein